jgi:hypothetical protein
MGSSHWDVEYVSDLVPLLRVGFRIWIPDPFQAGMLEGKPLLRAQGKVETAGKL